MLRGALGFATAVFLLLTTLFPATLCQESGASPTVAAGEVGNPGWGFKFVPPEGWKFQQDMSMAILGHDTIPGMIVVAPHEATDLEQAAAQMQEGITEEGVALHPTGAVSRHGDNALVAVYSGLFQGQQAKARGIGTLSPHGGGAFILAVTTPESFGPELVAAMDQIASAVRYFKVDVSDLVRHFVGRWASYSGNSAGGTLSNLTFHPDGTFADDSETSYNMNYSGDGWGTPDTNVGAVGVSGSRARWTVRGTREAGVITIHLPDGTKSTIEYRVFVERGQTYWTEYLFNGRHYAKQ